MSEREEWGPWIDHDGKGCPSVGAWVRAVFEQDGVVVEDEGRAGSMGGHSWRWDSEIRCAKVLRYRIRKPRGLTILQELLENLPEGVKEGERV